MPLLTVMTTPGGLKFDQMLVKFSGYSLVNWLFARQAGIQPRPALLLQTQGRRSGLWRQAVLPYFVDGENLVIVGSMGGAPADPQWIANLRALPLARVVVARRSRPVSAQEATGSDYERLWQQVCTLVPVYTDYQARCEASRRIPLMILCPAA